MLRIIDGVEYDVVWEPIPDSSQEFALDTRCDETLYCGTRGPGKTATQLMAYRREVGLGYGAFWRGIILDKEYKNFTDIVKQSKKFFLAFDDGAKFHSSASEFRWSWPTGEELLFRHLKKDSDYDSIHGHEYAFIGWNELTKHATPNLYRKVMSTNRTSFVPEQHTPKELDKKGNPTGRYDTFDGNPLPPIPLIVFSTTNPNGPGHNWVKRQFIDVAPYGTPVSHEITVYDPQKKEEVVVVRKQVAIFGSYKENIYLSPNYIAGLDKLCQGNENLRKAWLEGDWDFTAGGAFDDLWNRDIHVVPNFVVPEEWYLDRSFDWGSTHPFSVGWWAMANGEEVELPTGEIFTPARGSLIQVAEDYGAKEIGLNEGLKLSSDDISDRIIAVEKRLLRDKWIKRQPSIGPADNQIRDVTQIDQETIAVKMAKKGIRWERSDKNPGSRKIGLQLARDRLEASVTKEGPGLYFMARCKSTISIIPSLPRDPLKSDDVDTHSEDHIWDMMRYRILKSSSRYAKHINVQLPN